MVMAQRTSPPFRAEYIGSLRRPDELVQKRLAFDAGSCTREELQECEDRSIKDIVQMQRDVGLKTITDGEFRRRWFFEVFWDSLEGMTFVPQSSKDGEYFAEGSYETIAVRLFNELNVDVYYLEYDRERAGTFELLRFLPPDKFIVLGIITTKSPQLEDPDEMVAKVHEAARNIASGQKRPYEAVLDQIALARSVGLPLAGKDMRNKLHLLIKVSKMIWGT
ncbi:hypothetical protein EWM64_g10033 [Hericium alpestre]|uniref:Cobalamin-independent methionine synthase MetE C-terminal/archaeal domain-containing protein n=1 Tax=Hericium alpestre TaxID=135208 RepID=A0A4Y9ZKM2_9AGAM|nr:hypothetical protein EWM64_g10033 [Hericium alpestre]